MKLFVLLLIIAGLIDQYTAIDGKWTQNCKPDGKCGEGHVYYGKCDTRDSHRQTDSYCGKCIYGWRRPTAALNDWCCSWKDYTENRDCKCPASSSGECKLVLGGHFSSQHFYGQGLEPFERASVRNVSISSGTSAINGENAGESFFGQGSERIEAGDLEDSFNTIIGPRRRDGFGTEMDDSTLPEGCLKDEAMVMVKARVVFSKRNEDKSFAYKEQTTFAAHYEHEHKTVEYGLKLGGAFELISGALGLQFKKTVDTASANAYQSHTIESGYQDFQDNLYQIYRKITTQVKINGQTATLEEEKYVDAMPKNDSVTNHQWETYFEDLATAYVQDNFNVTEDEIDKSGDGVSYGQAFCTLAARCQAGWQSNKDTNGGQTSIIGNFESAEECAMRVYLEHPEAVGATWWTESAYTCEAIYGNTTVRDVILPFTHKVKTCIFKDMRPERSASSKAAQRSPQMMEANTTGLNENFYSLEENFDCNVLPNSPNGAKHEKGCRGAVWGNGDPSPDYCRNKDGRRPWYTHCCKWEYQRCLPKNPADECSEERSEKWVTVTTQIEYFQRAFHAYAEYVYNSTWTASFKSQYEGTDAGGSIEGGIEGKFSGSLAVDVGNTLREVAANAGHSKNTEGIVKVFHDDELQLVRRVITVISIGGTTVRREWEEQTDTYPHSQRKSPKQLKEKAIKYMKDTYHPTDSMIPNEKIALFEESACTFDLPCKPVRGQLYKEENRMNLDYDNARACAYAVLKSDPKAVGITWHNPKNGGTKHCWAHKDMSIPIGKIENKDDVNNNFFACQFEGKCPKGYATCHSCCEPIEDGKENNHCKCDQDTATLKRPAGPFSSRAHSGLGRINEDLGYGSENGGQGMGGGSGFTSGSGAPRMRGAFTSEFGTSAHGMGGGYGSGYIPPICWGGTYKACEANCKSIIPDIGLEACFFVCRQACVFGTGSRSGADAIGSGDESGATSGVNGIGSGSGREAIDIQGGYGSEGQGGCVMHGNVCHRGTAIPCCGSMHCNDELPHNPDAVGWPGICRGEVLAEGQNCGCDMTTTCIPDSCKPGLTCTFEGPGYGFCSNTTATMQSGKVSKPGTSWYPNVESLFRYESEIPAGALKNNLLSLNGPGSSIELHADVKVQSFGDKTLRVKLDHPRFFSNENEISLMDAYRMLTTEGSQMGVGAQGQGDAAAFQMHLQEPMLVHLKQGKVKSFVVSRNEPMSVTNLKKSICSSLEKHGNDHRLQLIKKQAIMTPFVIPAQPKKIRGGVPTMKMTGGRPCPSCVYVKTMDELQSQLSGAGQKLVVIDFFTKWSGHSRLMDPTLQELAVEYHDAIFLKVDVDQVEGATAKYEITVIPTFRFIKGGQTLGELKGAFVGELRREVARFSRRNITQKMAISPKAMCPRSKQITWHLNGDFKQFREDRIWLVKSCDGSVPAGKVRLSLMSTVTGGKAITLHRGGRFIYELVSVKDQPYTRKFADLPVSDLRILDLYLAKAKSLSIHCDMYEISNAEDMQGGCEYLFKWAADL